MIDDILPQTERFEDLRAAIALDRGDAHLGHDLDHALRGGLHEIRARLLVVDSGEQPFADHVVDRLERDIRIDGGRAVADEQREVMHLARFAGFKHERDARAEAFANQIMVQAGNGEQRGNRRGLARDAAIAEDDHVDFVLLDHATRHDREFLHRFRESLLAARDAEQNRQHADAKAGQIRAGGSSRTPRS